MFFASKVLLQKPRCQSRREHSFVSFPAEDLLNPNSLTARLGSELSQVCNSGAPNEASGAKTVVP